MLVLDYHLGSTGCNSPHLHEKELSTSNIDSYNKLVIIILGDNPEVLHLDSPKAPQGAFWF